MSLSISLKSFYLCCWCFSEQQKIKRMKSPACLLHPRALWTQDSILPPLPGSTGLQRGTLLLRVLHRAAQMGHPVTSLIVAIALDPGALPIPTVLHSPAYKTRTGKPSPFSLQSFYFLLLSEARPSPRSHLQVENTHTQQVLGRRSYPQISLKIQTASTLPKTKSKTSPTSDPPTPVMVTAPQKPGAEGHGEDTLSSQLSRGALQIHTLDLLCPLGQPVCGKHQPRDSTCQELQT